MKFRNYEFPDEGLVLITGVPGVGKSSAMITAAQDLKQNGIKTLLLYTDAVAAHDSVHYEKGETRIVPSKLSRVQKAYPELPYVEDDRACRSGCYYWRDLLTDIIEHEGAKVIFIDRIAEQGKVVPAETLQMMQRVAKENHVLIMAEINLRRPYTQRKCLRPKVGDVLCARGARRYVDRVAFVVREEDGGGGTRRTPSVAYGASPLGGGAWGTATR